jgi:hypothetical protein
MEEKVKYRKGDKVWLFGVLQGFKSEDKHVLCPIFSRAPARVLEARDRQDGWQNIKVKVLKHRDGILTWVDSHGTGWAHSWQIQKRA